MHYLTKSEDKTWLKSENINVKVQNWLEKTLFLRSISSHL